MRLSLQWNAIKKTLGYINHSTFFSRSRILKDTSVISHFSWEPEEQFSLFGLWSSNRVAYEESTETTVRPIVMKVKLFKAFKRCASWLSWKTHDAFSSFLTVLDLQTSLAKCSWRSPPKKKSISPHPQAMSLLAPEYPSHCIVFFSNCQEFCLAESKLHIGTTPGLPFHPVTLYTPLIKEENVSICWT